MIYTTTKTAIPYPIEPIVLSFRKTNVIRGYEISIKGTGIKALFNTIKYNKEESKYTFLYGCLPSLSFNIDGIGFENVKRIKAFADKYCDTIEYGLTR